VAQPFQPPAFLARDSRRQRGDHEVISAQLAVGSGASTAASGGVVIGPFLGHRIPQLTAKVKQNELLFLKELIEVGKVTPIVERTDAEPAPQRRSPEKQYLQGRGPA
jgi:hypothetical protein